LDDANQVTGRRRNRRRCHVNIIPQQIAAALCQVRILYYYGQFSLELQSDARRPLALPTCLHAVVPRQNVRVLHLKSGHAKKWTCTKRTAGHTGKWTADEDRELKDAVKTHGGKNWVAITALVPGRTRNQCSSRWHEFLDPSIDRATGSKGKWSENEDTKLQDAVQTNGGKNWGLIAELVPGRTQIQCYNRWKYVLDPNIDRASGRMGSWAAVEDSKLKDVVETHGVKNWVTIAELVPGRTHKQCCNRWHDSLDPSIDPTMVRTGK
jgi:uncharacterized protein (DUF2237 family)